MSLGQAVTGALGGLTIANGGTVVSPQAGNITMSTANRTMWEADNLSEDINAWDPTEFRNFVKWFIEVHHPDAVKQYQAIRDIERQAEHAKRLEYEAKQAEYMKQFWANKARAAQNAYQYPTTATQGVYGIAVQEEPKQQGFFDVLKRMIQE